MTSRNENTPPVPRSPLNRNRVVDDGPLDKCRKIGGRQALAPMNDQKDAVAPSATKVSQSENIEFSREEADALLNETSKGKKVDSKGEQEWMIEHIKKLNVCIKWFQKNSEDLEEENENLRKMLGSSERKFLDAEAAMKSEKEELNTTISELEIKITHLKDSLAKEESEKLDALNCCHKREKEARIDSEKILDFFKEMLAKMEQNLLTAIKRNRVVDDAPLDKCRKIGGSRMMASTNASRGRKALAPMQIGGSRMMASTNATEVSESENIEFSKEEAAALLNETSKGKKFDSKGEQEWMIEQIKKLEHFQREQESMLEDIEKLKDIVNCHKIEKEARIDSEKNQDSTKEKLARVEQDLLTAISKIQTQEDAYKRLQQYSSDIQTELKAATDSNKQSEREKAAILDSHTTLRGHYSLLQEEFTSAKDSRDDAMKQKEAAEKEVDILRSELQQIRQDRDRQLLREPEFTSKLQRLGDTADRALEKCYKLVTEVSALEKTCQSQRERIIDLENELASALSLTS